MLKICLYLTLVVGVSLAAQNSEQKEETSKIKINDGAKVQVPVSDVTDGEVVISPNDPVSLEQPDEVNKEGLEPSETAWGGRGYGGWGRGWGGGWGGGYGGYGGWGGRGYSGGWGRGYGGYGDGWGGYRRGWGGW